MYEIFEQLLQNYGLTTYKFCKESGISQSTISTWKKKNAPASMDLAQKIAAFFNVSVDYLMTGKDIGENKYYINEETAKVAQEIFENRELRALFDVQRDMDQDDLRALHSMALALKRKERGDMDDTGC